ncbi:uncharacterized protein LOC132618063 [Lycium barbarum]|uniref:uncharacterized protein LOC132618063 n=1 Tax=Lycium barbarum TaxID=112863 RepID=UPI00293F0095|nr:uncharacterized protein LOC132618063 [Lycium barbarum]
MGREVAYLQAQLMQVKGQLAQNFINSVNSYNDPHRSNSMALSGQMAPANPNYNNVKSNSSPQSSSLESVDHYSDCHGINMQDIQSLDHFLEYQNYTKSRPFLGVQTRAWVNFKHWLLG